ncbi:hypothetical protein [Aquisediminimonas sediminicola]|uniref:hypothetical protein n=1 Tax=Alteraquisediminimonas sediminicola TaxID=2676787 RepID=UPI001C8E707E|nr:hypothetical protein [Aquisediminimonas sediminicola]
MDLNPAFDDSMAFIRREYRLILPVAVSTMGLAILLLGLVIPPISADGQFPPGPWLWWLIPVGFMTGVGTLGLSALRLFPGLSVGEALRHGLRNVIPLLLVLFATLVLLLFALSVLGVVLMMLLGSAPEAAVIEAMIFGMPLTLYLGARMSLASCALIARHPHETPIKAIKRGIAMTKGHSWRIALIMMAGFFVYLFMLFTLTAVFGSLFLLLGKLIGDPAFGETLTRLLITFYVSVFFASFTILLASIYQRLSARSNGI